jgi:hypothetical protein
MDLTQDDSRDQLPVESRTHRIDRPVSNRQPSRGRLILQELVKVRTMLAETLTKIDNQENVLIVLNRLEHSVTALASQQQTQDLDSAGAAAGRSTTKAKSVSGKAVVTTGGAGNMQSCDEVDATRANQVDPNKAQSNDCQSEAVATRATPARADEASNRNEAENTQSGADATETTPASGQNEAQSMTSGADATEATPARADEVGAQNETERIAEPAATAGSPEPVSPEPAHPPASKRPGPGPLVPGRKRLRRR